MIRHWGLGLAGACALFGLQLAAGAERAQACGGLFCNASQPVNQAAERIVFVENGDGTVTALIEIQYSGPSERFSWVLPVPGTPQVKVSSALALNRLQGATNPQYRLQTTFAQGCGGRAGGPTSAPGAAIDGANRGESESPVMRLASGTVGPYNYEVLSVTPGTPNPATVAVAWLEGEGFDIPPATPDVLDPYLENGLNLIAFRLTKDGTTGSIRPIVITYTADQPFIPIRPTAVAAQDDMGVMVWTLSDARAVPANYKALELNEALINWFNPMSTYNDVVSAAADEAEGQGFVTELAGDSTVLANVVLNQNDVQQWQRLSTQTYTKNSLFVTDAKNTLGGWDGFESAIAKAVPNRPADLEITDIINCPGCYVDDPAIGFNPTVFLRALYEDVYAPMAETQALVMSRPYVTRLYTTMSADEMTMDPAFDFNADLPDVSNLHMATQILDCEGGFEIKLPQGPSVYGKQMGTWPNALGGDQPAARTIMQLSDKGDGRIVVDNSDRIDELLIATAPGSAAKPDGGLRPAHDGGSADAGADAGDGGVGSGDDGGCHAVAVGAHTERRALALLMALLAVTGARRARRREQGYTQNSRTALNR